jgi:hypothetical protein
MPCVSSGPWVFPQSHRPGSTEPAASKRLVRWVRGMEPAALLRPVWWTPLNLTCVGPQLSRQVLEQLRAVEAVRSLVSRLDRACPACTCGRNSNLHNGHCVRSRTRPDRLLKLACKPSTAIWGASSIQIDAFSTSTGHLPRSELSCREESGLQSSLQVWHSAMILS